MRQQIWLACVLVTVLWTAPAKGDTGVIVRTTNLPALQVLCALPITCTVVRGLDGTLGQVFLVTTPLPLDGLLNLLNGVTGFVDAEVDQVLSLIGGLNLVPTTICGIAGCDPTLMSDRTAVPYPAGSSTTAWNSYVNQPAAGVVEVQTAQSRFSVTGTGIVVADIDTGVDPNHPVLQPWLLTGYDFTRNQAGGSEMTDLSPSVQPTCTTTCPAPAQVNQSTAAVLDQSTAAVLDNQYAAFGHGTMVMGVIHLVAPTAQLLPLKAFKSDGTANLSDILHAIYYAAQPNASNPNVANVINMSFDTTTASTELKNALDYANGLGVICAASAGNDNQPGPPRLVYPAALQSDVIGVASVGSTSSTAGTKSTFSNFGNGIVWVAAPGEQIVTTYPFSSYAAGWGTSFSAPFVSGAAALLRNRQANINESMSAAAVAHAVPIGPDMGHGRLDLVQALQAMSVNMRNDFDGDGQTDIGVWRPSTGEWLIIPSGNPSSAIERQWGIPGDIPVPGDYDGDGETDFAVWRPSNGLWYIIPSSNPGSPFVQQWGIPGDIPVPGDYDGDGKTDFAVWRPSIGEWLIIPSGNPGSAIERQWGIQGDIPVPGDYDGDGKTDFAVWRPSNGLWYIIPSSNPGSAIERQWGIQGDIPVPGDYDGDGKTDVAVWRPSNGLWYIIPSSNPGSPIVQQWGTNGDVPVQKPIGQ